MKFDLNTNKTHKKIALQKEEYKIKSIILKKQNFFFIKRLKTILIISSLCILYQISASITDFKNIGAILKLPLGFAWLLKNFIPNKDSLQYFPIILKSFLETCAVAISATTLSALLAFLFAIISSETTGLNKITKIIFSIFASFLRNVPLVAWSMVLLFSFKQNNFTGFLALFIITFGHLLRTFKEMIDETSSESFEALRALGAPYFSAIFQSVIPNTAAGFISWLLYAIETNVRDSALIGILTGTGIGFLFNLYFKSFRYNCAGLIIFLLIITVLIIDVVSNKIRKGLL